MAATTPAIRAARAAAIFLSTFAAGANLSLSYFLVPRLLESPTSLMLQQWQRTYERGRDTIAPTGGAAAAVYLYLAHQAGWHRTRAGAACAAAAALCIGIGPWTRLVMGSTNRELLARAERARAMGLAEAAVLEVREEVVREQGSERERAESARGLVDWWGVLNLARGAMLASAAGLGLWVAL